MSGFYTEEVRNEANIRIGFDVIDISQRDKKSPLARIKYNMIYYRKKLKKSSWYFYGRINSSAVLSVIGPLWARLRTDAPPFCPSH